MHRDSSTIQDWNDAAGTSGFGAREVLLEDETLRDGLQSPSVRQPTIDEKLRILHFMEGLGIQIADIGLPGAGPASVAAVERIAREIGTCRLKIRPNCAARTLESDIRPIADIMQRTGVPIAVAAFLGTSPIRRQVEDWTDDFLLRTTEQAVTYARSLGLEVMYVTEDTSRCDPDTIKRLYSAAINCGATTIVLCDTVGHATPAGAAALVRFVIDSVVRPSGARIQVDWHGHSDRGLGLANSIAALQAGADCAHGTVLGIGERSGNTPIDQLLVNLKLMGARPWGSQDLSALKEYCATVSRATDVAIPANYPVFGRDAFRTATGVHAAAIRKAFKKGDIGLADSVYSGVPAHDFGLEQVIDIGPMSGSSNVLFWLERHGVDASPTLVTAILDCAKSGARCLTTEEILACCAAVTDGESREPVDAE
jgi:2-isopropylmalate synthase